MSNNELKYHFEALTTQIPGKGHRLVQVYQGLETKITPFNKILLPTLLHTPL